MMALDADIVFSIRDLIYIVGIIATGVGVWFSLKYRIQDISDKANAAAKDAIKALSETTDIKLDILKNYPIKADMKELEERLSGQLNVLTTEIRSISSFLMGKNSVT